MTKTVYAHTPPGSDFPPFVNLSSQEDGTYTLTVRSHGNGGRDMGSIKMSPEAVEALTTAALADLYGETPATSGLNFGEAIAALKAGQRIARTGWNGKGMFVYLVPPASYPVQTGAAKAYFGEGAMVPYNAYMAIKNVDDTVSTWVPSVNDCLATDWCTVGESVATAPLNLPVIDPGPDSLEREIQARGLPARYVTPADIEAEIAAEYSTTLNKALAGCPQLEGLDRVTLAVIVLKNGTKLVGVNYGAIDPARHNPAMGAKEARADAIEQAWPLLGFRLRDELSRPVLTEGDVAADLAGTCRPDNHTSNCTACKRED